MSRFKSQIRAGLLAGLFGFAAAGAAFAEAPNADIRNGVQAPPPADQRVALVIGNSNYQTAPKLTNPGNDAQSVAQLLNSAGFEVTQATDLTRERHGQGGAGLLRQGRRPRPRHGGDDLLRRPRRAAGGRELSASRSMRRSSSPSDLDGNSLRLVDVMGTLETIPSRMRIVVLDACRNNPFPDVDDAGRGLAIVDAPSGSIVGYSTAPGMEAQDGDGNHSPYTSAFLHLARASRICRSRQLFKRVRLEVNNPTDGRADAMGKFVADLRLLFLRRYGGRRNRARRIAARSSRPRRICRRVRCVRPMTTCCPKVRRNIIEEFIRMFPHDPLCDRIRLLLGNLLVGDGVAQGRAGELTGHLQDRSTTTTATAPTPSRR